MSNLNNENENIFITLTPIFCNDFGVMCDFNLKTEILCLDFKKVNYLNRYMSHENISHIRREIIKLNDLGNFREEEELVISIYPIDMFFTIDVFKADDNLLFIKLRIPIGIYTNSETTGYDFGLDFFAKVDNFKLFLEKFISDCQNL